MKAPKRTHQVRTNKTNYMSDKAFGDLKEALEGALEFERGERQDLPLTRIAAPASQTVTARKASLNDDTVPSSCDRFHGEERS